MIIDLTSPEADPTLFGRAYTEVLEPSFTPEELPVLDAFEVMFDGTGTSTLSVLVEDGEPSAAAVSIDVPDLGIGLLAWLAARPGRRSRGAGARMLAHLRSRWASGSCDVVLGEIHDPRFWTTTEDEDPTARLRFYQRNECDLLAVPWVQPRTAPHLERVPDMLLIVVHLTEDVRRNGVDGEALRRWTAGYFAGEEGGVPTDGSTAP